MSAQTILVTGASGFVGQYLLPALRAAFPDAAIIGTGREPDNAEILEVTNKDSVGALFARLQPDVCVHLAGIASIGAAKANPNRAWEVNLHGTLNVAQAILEHAPNCRMMFVSSAECYGGSFKSGLALNETAPLAPLNLYAATKAAAEVALGALAAEGLRVLRLRPFNHTGPGQTEDYVVPSFAGQIARIEAGLAPPEMAVGALTPERDFLDVRDVCAAYVKIIQNFDQISNNKILNIASGTPVKIGALLARLVEISGVALKIVQDPARLRPVEILRAAGKPAEILDNLGWRQEFSLDETLLAVLHNARRAVAKST